MSIHIGMIGAGGIAQAHLLAYARMKRIKRVSIAEVQPEALKRAADSFGLARAVADYRQLLDDPSIDLVDICLPHDLHASVAKKALRAGKDVIVEKPIARTSLEAKAMIDVAHETGRRLFVSMNHLYMPYHQRAKRLIDSGALGQVFLAVIHVSGNELSTLSDPGHWKGTWERAGGGVMIDTGYHAVYLLVHLFGKPRSAFGSARRLVVQAENKADDNTACILEYDHMTASLSLSYSVTSEAWSERRYVYGTRASLHIQDSPFEPLAMYREGQRKVLIPGDPSGPHPHPESIHRCLREILRAYESDGDCLASPELALDALRVEEAIYRSSRSGKKAPIA